MATSPSVAELFVATARERAGALEATAALDRALATALDEARSAWPEVEVSSDAFVAFLASKLTVEALRENAATAVRAARTSELYLVCACAAGDEKAVTAFEAHYAETIAQAVRRRVDKGGLVDEAKQVLLERLFVAHDGAPAKITEYAGRGDLGAFLRVAAARISLNLVRSEKRRAAVNDAAAAVPLPLDDPELARIEARYKDDFRAALQDAARDLSTRERNLLRQHHIDGLTMAELATMYGLHRVTVVRAIQAAREKLAAETKRRLRERLRIDALELDSLLRVVGSQLDLSIQRYLGGAEGLAG